MPRDYFFNRAGKILAKGSRSRISVSDLEPVKNETSSTYLADRFEEYMDGKAISGINIFRGFANVLGGYFLKGSLMSFLANCSMISSVYVLQSIIFHLPIKPTGYFTTPRSELFRGLGLCILIFCLRMCMTMATNDASERYKKTSVKIKALVCSVVYRKSLKLSPQARKQFNSGTISNLIDSDSYCLEMAAQFINEIWSSPLVILVVSICLIIETGSSALIGIAVMIALVPIQVLLFILWSRFNARRVVVTDERLAFLQDMIDGIRVVKFYAWESYFLKHITFLRDKELRIIRHGDYYLSASDAICAAAPSIAVMFTFIYRHLQGGGLSINAIVPVIMLYNIMSAPLRFLPISAGLILMGSQSIGRIRDLLSAEEVHLNVQNKIQEAKSKNIIDIKSSEGTSDLENFDDFSSKVHSNSGSLLIQDADFVWNSESKSADLESITLHIKPGSLVFVIGEVGSGKSSLLAAIMGEMICRIGTVEKDCDFAYCPQQAWIMNETVRENIIFGLEWRAELYTRVVEACALQHDFNILPYGDMTEIGERGANLSGGQKQRISLARTAYRQASVILLDDTFSAVDANVGKMIFEECIIKLMRDQTRIIVTHQLNMLPFADHVVVMKGGRISEQGSYKDLMNDINGVLYQMSRQNLISETSELSESVLKLSDVDKKSNIQSFLASPTVDPMVLLSTSTMPVDLNGIIENEESKTGEIETKVYREYFKSAGGLSLITCCILAVVCNNIFRVTADRWMSIWIEDKLQTSSQTFYISGYAIIVFLLLICSFFHAFTIMIGVNMAAKNLHAGAIEGIVKVPISFFDRNPSGRIISRFSKDLNILDNQIRRAFAVVTICLGIVFVAFVTMCVLVWELIPLPIIVLFIFYRLQSFFRKTSRQLKRLEAQARSPYASNTAESLSGLVTIRAFGRIPFFVKKAEALSDEVSKASFAIAAVERWLFLRLESTNNLTLLLVTLGCHLLSIEKDKGGYAILCSLLVNGSMSWCAMYSAEIESNIISAERLFHYWTELDREANLINENDKLLKEWPNKGEIKMQNLCMRYRPGLPLVLDNLSVEIKAGDKIGIVGRTGAGKSSIMLALFRMMEPEEGSKIYIDGVDIMQVGIHTLRSRLSIIPQDPVLFSNTLRWNIDPEGSCSDEELWAVIERANLKSCVKRLDKGLDTVVGVHGISLSVGQRQLLCLARAMVRKSKIIILDEATANVDLATDEFVQKSIMTEFKNCTVLTIAHRLATVMEYDRIMVLSQGKIIEFDSPERLLADDKSKFTFLMRESQGHS